MWKTNEMKNKSKNIKGNVRKWKNIKCVSFFPCSWMSLMLFLVDSVSFILLIFYHFLFLLLCSVLVLPCVFMLTNFLSLVIFFDVLPCRVVVSRFVHVLSCCCILCCFVFFRAADFPPRYRTRSWGLGGHSSANPISDEATRKKNVFTTMFHMRIIENVIKNNCCYAYWQRYKIFVFVCFLSFSFMFYKGLSFLFSSFFLFSFSFIFSTSFHFL